MSNKESLSNLVEVIDLVLKKCERQSKFRDVYDLDITNYKRSANLGKRCSEIVNDCLGSHRFNDAAKLLWVMCQDRSCFDTLLYKGIMVVLENIHLNDKDETVMKFSCDIQDQGTRVLINKRDVHLEYILYALRNNVPDIQSCYKKVTYKRRPQMLKKIPGIDQVLVAYLALLDYIAWRNCCQDELLIANANNYADKATSGFKSVIEHPGTWDIFIIKLIEILEHYQKYEDIEDILKKYVECNPEHINAYIYVCVHFHKYNKDPQVFIQYAKVLAKLCPSDVRVLLLIQTWNEQGAKLKKRLKILFMFMDYPVNGKNVLGWRLLSSHLSEAVLSQRSKYNIVKSEWKLRFHAWSNMHFNSLNDSSGLVDNLDLIAYKVKVLNVLQPDHEYIKAALRKFSHLLEPKSSYNGHATTEDYNNIYRLDD